MWADGGWHTSGDAYVGPDDPLADPTVVHRTGDYWVRVVGGV